MTQPLPVELQSLVDLSCQNPNLTGSIRALLVLLKNAPDSSIIKTALGQINPDDIEEIELRTEAANLLEMADAPELAGTWRVQTTEFDATNVVPLVKPAQGAAKPFKGNSISFDDIGGLEDVKRQVRRKIINPFKNTSIFKKFKRKAGGGVLMYGPPGCGKTMLARALATECDAVFHDVRAADILDQYVGNAEKRIAHLFETARASRPAVLFFDEVEALAQRRQFETTARVNTVVSALLTEMDGFNGDNENMLFLGATNVPWALDGAFRRPGRFDRTIFVPPPDKIARAFILGVLLNDRPVSPKLSTAKIIDKTSGFSGADMSALVDTAIDFAIEESRSDDDIEPLSNGHFSDAIKEVKSSVGEWLGQARNFAEYANGDGQYDELAAFLKKYG